MLMSGVKQLLVPISSWSPTKEKPNHPPHSVRAAKATVKSLSLFASRVPEDELAVEIPYYSSLQRLDLSFACATRFIAGLAAHLPHLQVLKLQRSFLTNAGAWNLARCENLRLLDVSSCKLTGEGISAVATITSLTALYAGMNRVSKESMCALAENSSLTLLDLNGCRANEREPLSGILTSLTGLVHLSLGACDLDDNAASYLAHLPRLTHLCLADNYLQSCPMFTLNVASRIRTLDLSSNRIDDRSLANSFLKQSLPVLTSLLITGNLLPPRFIQAQLVNALPLIQLNVAKQRLHVLEQEIFKPITNTTLCFLDLSIDDQAQAQLTKNIHAMIERRKTLILILLSASHARRRFIEGKGDFFSLSKLPLDLFIHVASFLPAQLYGKSASQLSSLATFVCHNSEAFVPRLQAKQSAKVVESMKEAEWNFHYSFTKIE